MRSDASITTVRHDGHAAGGTLIDRRWLSDPAGHHEDHSEAAVWIPVVIIFLLNLACAYAFWAKVNFAWPFSR